MCEDLKVQIREVRQESDKNLSVKERLHSQHSLELQGKLEQVRGEKELEVE